MSTFTFEEIALVVPKEYSGSRESIFAWLRMTRRLDEEKAQVEEEYREALKVIKTFVRRRFTAKQRVEVRGKDVRVYVRPQYISFLVPLEQKLCQLKELVLEHWRRVDVVLGANLYLVSSRKFVYLCGWFFVGVLLSVPISYLLFPRFI